MKGRARLLAVVFVLALCAPAVGQRRRAGVRRPQTAFGAETPIRRPVRLSADATRQILESDRERVRACGEFGGQPAEAIAAQLAGSAVDINGDALPDLIAQAGPGCFMGAHATTFWAFAGYSTRFGNGVDLVLMTPGDFLRVLASVSNGYRDIETGYATAAEVYATIWKFDGDRYQPRECTIKDFKTGRVQRTRCASPEPESAAP